MGNDAEQRHQAELQRLRDDLDEAFAMNRIQAAWIAELVAKREVSDLEFLAPLLASLQFDRERRPQGSFFEVGKRYGEACGALSTNDGELFVASLQAMVVSAIRVYSLEFSEMAESDK